MEVRWDKVVTEPAGEYTCTFFNGKREKNKELGTVSFTHKENISVVNRVEFAVVNFRVCEIATAL